MRRRQRGTTLIEMLVTGVIMATLGCALWLGWMNGYTAWDTVRSSNNAYANGRAAADRMADELRGATALTSAAATSIAFKNSAGTSVTYTLTNGGLRRTVGSGSATTVLGIASMSLSYVLSTGGTSSAPSSLSIVRGVVITMTTTDGDTSRSIVTTVRMRNF